MATQLLSDLAGARGDLQAVEREVTDLGGRLARAQYALAALRRTGASVTAAERQVRDLTQAQAAALTRLAAARTRFDDLHQQFVAGLPPAGPPGLPLRPPQANLIGPLRSDVPIVLFPVRIETRFQGGSGATDLLVRVYPDDVHINTHEPELTDDEAAYGRQFWEATWRSGRSGEDARQRELAAWAQLAERFGPERAAWIARALEPRNPAARPAGPLADGAPFTTAPSFPQPPARAASWTRPPRAALLPDRWVVIGYSLLSGRLPAFTAVGSRIPDPLPAGPAPDLASAPPAAPPSGDGVLLVDPGMRWLVDFEAAMAAGMAVRVRMPFHAENQLTRLLVLGVRGAVDDAASARELAAHLDAQHYTRGVGFLRPGTPSNNTADAPSGYKPQDPGHERSFATERGQPLFQAGNGRAGDLVAPALGVSPAVLDHLWGAGLDAHRAPRWMNTALWPATWGYFLEKRLRGVVSDDELAGVRRHFIDFVRAGGPLPALRMGKQPYGLLPATALDRWKPVDASDVAARAITALIQARNAFRRALENVPRLVPGSSPDQALLSLLRMEPFSSAYHLRWMVGPHYADNVFSFMGVDLNASWWGNQELLAWLPVHAYPGMTPATPQSASLFAPGSGPFQRPLVQADAAAPDAPLAPDYITPLASAGWQQIRADGFAGTGPRPLLYRLLRHATLLEYGSAAFRIQLAAGQVTAAQRGEVELIDFDPASPTPTIWRALERTVPGVTGSRTLGQFLDDPARERHPGVGDLGELRAALRELGRLGVADLQRLMGGTLDLASHRLDAWITSLATRRLRDLRSRRPGGVFLGAYGWVEDLRRGSARMSDGHLHAPSIAHASTAAILASTFLSHRNPGAPGPFDIDLSSERARLARWLLDGVRGGQPLAALLGYRIERALHAQRLDRYIAPFRRLAPLASSPSAPAEPSESIAASNVVHGLELLRMWKASDPRFLALRTSLNIADFVRIDAELRAIDGVVDALGDVLMSENVYQIVQGNFSRAGSSLDLVARGETLPEPEILQTPRTGVGLTHRVLILFGANPTVPAGWRADARHVRARAEPQLHGWVAGILGDPARVRCRAEYLDPATGSPVPAGVRPIEVRLSDLELSPLDVVSIPTAAPGSQEGELERRLIHFLMRMRPVNVPAGARVRLDYGRDPAWPADVLSMGELLEVSRAVGRLLAGARAAGAADLAPPDEPPAPGIDLAELRARADGTVAALRQARADLQALLERADQADLDALRAVLLRFSYFGFLSAVPVSALGSAPADRAALVDQARALGRDAGGRIAAIAAAEGAFSEPATALEAQRDHQVERIRLALGADFPVLPRVTPASAGELVRAFGASTALLGGNTREMVTWLARTARVREGVERLADVLRLSEALGRTVGAAFTVGQLPFQAGDRWVGLPLAPGARLAPGRLSLVALNPLSLAATRPVAGLVVDEWSEVVPSPGETTGLAFHYDEPGARAPHAILLAVAPDTTKPWDLEALEAVVFDTLELARLRTVDDEAMVELDHYLPALYFAVNQAGDTVSTSFRD